MAYDNTAAMTDLAAKAQNIGNVGYTGFGQSTQVDANPWQQQAWQNTFNRGMQGAEEVSDARTQLQGTINGQGFKNNPYLQQSNPYLQQSIDNAAGDITRNYNMAIKPQTQSAMVSGGSFGNSGMQQVENEQQRQLADTIGKTSSNMRFADYQQQGQMYEAERNRQMQATGMAPSFANVDYTDLQAMQQAGNSMQGQNQGERTAAYNQYLDAREWPFKTLDAQGKAMGSGGGGSASYQQQQQPNTSANALGGALAGAQLGSAFGGWGTAGGALLGGLLGSK